MTGFIYTAIFAAILYLIVEWLGIPHEYVMYCLLILTAIGIDNERQNNIAD